MTRKLWTVLVLKDKRVQKSIFELCVSMISIELGHMTIMSTSSIGNNVYSSLIEIHTHLHTPNRSMTSL